MYLFLFSKWKVDKITARFYKKCLTFISQKLEGNISHLPDAFILDDNTAFYTPISFGNHRISNIALSSSLTHCHWSCLPIITRAGRWLCETSFIFRKIWMLLYILTLKWACEGTENEYLSVHGVHSIAEKYSGMWRCLWIEYYFPLAPKMKHLWSILHCSLTSSFTCFALEGTFRMAALWLHWYLLPQWKTLLCLKRFTFSNEKLCWNGNVTRYLLISSCFAPDDFV